MSQSYGMVAKKANVILGNKIVLLSRSRELIVLLYYILSQPYLEYYAHFIFACHKLGEIFPSSRGEFPGGREGTMKVLRKISFKKEVSRKKT